MSFEQIVLASKVNQDYICKIIKQGELHFAEVKAKVVLVCISSILEFLDEELSGKFIAREKEYVEL